MSFYFLCVHSFAPRYQPDLLSEDEKDELKLADRRAEEVLLIKIASAVAYDLGTIDPEVLASESGPKGTDILPGIDMYVVAVARHQLYAWCDRQSPLSAFVFIHSSDIARGAHHCCLVTASQISCVRG